MKSLTVSHVVLLICTCIAAVSVAHPLVNDYTEQLERLSGVQEWLTTQTIGIPRSTRPPTNIIYQIADGQVQAEGSPSRSSDTVPFVVPTSTSYLSARDPFARTTDYSKLEALVYPSLTVPKPAFLLPNATDPFSTSIPGSSLTYLTTSAVQTATAQGPFDVQGTVISSLEQTISSLPFLTTASYTTSRLSLVNPTALSDTRPTATSLISTLSVSDIFRAIATDSPPPQVSQRTDHPVPRLHIQPQQEKLQTNKFYSNLFLGNQSDSVFTFPYSVTWMRGGLVDSKNQSTPSWGMAVSHIDRNDVVYADGKIDPATGLKVDAGDWGFYSNPLGTKPIVLSASELVTTPDGSPVLATSSIRWGSVSVDLFAYGWQTPTVRFPLVQGVSFITANYNWATPLLQSGNGFQNITYVGTIGAAGGGSTVKYIAQLMGDVPVTWLIYITPDPVLCPGYPVDRFTYDGMTNLQGVSGFSGLIQVAKIPVDATSNHDIQLLYDQAAGSYVTDVKISGTVQDSVGSYTFSWETQGNLGQSLLMFALPHHVSSLAPDTAAGITGLKLMTPTKGIATAIQGTYWTLIESGMPIDMDFAPYSPTKGPIEDLSEETKSAIRTAGIAEISQNIASQTNTNSTYYDGKGLAKFAAIIYVLHQLVGEERLAISGLVELEKQFESHVLGQQTYPLVYESAWGGAVSTASYVLADSPGSAGVDFGNTYYNDHHFHYGYFVYAAAVIGYLDPVWLDQEINTAWVNMLVRDYANSIDDDPYFPFSRAFDWYHGHSWAEGLFDSADGKNQESSSEDTMASYAIKMWGQVIGDTTMMARGNLMLAIQARSLRSYYLYDSSNNVQPLEFIGNQAAGILFENKVDHTTFFGALPEYTQGIHMIPIMPFSTYIRTPAFVQQEWNAYFANYSDGIQPYIDRVQGGWRGVIMANYAIVDANASYGFFADDHFSQLYLDNGASRTWYLAWAAALREVEGS